MHEVANLYTIQSNTSYSFCGSLTKSINHIFHARLVSPPQTEKLRRKDAEVARALEEKHRLIADLLSMDPAEFDHIADVASARYLRLEKNIST